MKITDAIVQELNEELKHRDYPFRYKYIEFGKNITCMQITLPNMLGVDSFIIKPTKEFFDWLQNWCSERRIELSCDDDGSILWSIN